MKLLDPARPVTEHGHPCYLNTTIPIPCMIAGSCLGGGFKIGFKVPTALNDTAYKYFNLGETVPQFFADWLDDPEAALVKWMGADPEWQSKGKAPHSFLATPERPAYAPKPKATIDDLDF